MERVVRNRSFTLYKTFYVDGVAADPTGTPTVTVTRLSDGTTVATGAVTNEVAAGTWSVTVAATANTLLDTLTIDWAGVVNGTPQEYLDTVEVAGGTLFTLAEARAFGITTTYPDADVVDMRTTVEQEIEKECGCAFAPRYELETLSGDGSSSLRLRKPLVSSIRSVTVDGVAFTAPAIAAISIGLYGSLTSSTLAWTYGANNIVIGYEHGFQSHQGIKRPALILAKAWLIGQRSPIDDRALTFSSNEGGTYSLSVPGRPKTPFGIPDVDAAISRYDLTSMVTT